MASVATPLRALLTVVGAGLLLSGCGDLVFDPAAGLAGRAYHLDRVDGRRPPVVLDDDFLVGGFRCRLELLSASILFDRRDRYETSWAFRETCRSGTRTEVSYPLETERGDYSSRTGGTIRFYPDGYRDYDGRASGRDLTIDADGRRFLFRRDDLTGY
jgi:hypothetical protein